MNRLPGLLLALLLAACAATKKEPPPKPFAATRWQLVMEVPLKAEQPWFRFGDGRLEGFGGCSRITGRYVQDTVGARAIVIGKLDVDRRLCDVDLRNVESRMVEVLQAVSSYTITGDTMSMTGSGGTLRFRAVDAPK